MKLKFFLALGIIILGVGVFGYFKAISVPEDRENLPKIEVSPKDYNFGNINYGDAVNYTFLVKNVGVSLLEIKRVATSCACTTAKISKEVIEPGDAAELEVTYNSGQMTGSHGRGPQERIIFVKSSDPITPQAQVIIYGNVN